MKEVFFIFLISFSTVLFSQQIDYNEQKKFVASGYDVVAYFSKSAVNGSTNYRVTYDRAKYRFSSQKNLDAFKANPKKYIPEYGGWCAYAMADKAEKVSINPKTFEIRNGKLYLFYNALFNNTYESWLEEMPIELIKKADVNWSKIKFKS
jgi:YHS domain-containing protein